jgi:hypothetical protein
VILSTGNLIDEPISKRLKSVTPTKVSARKRAENTGFLFSPELQQQTFKIGSDVWNVSGQMGRTKEQDAA